MKIALTALTIIFLDQLTKYWAVASLQEPIWLATDIGFKLAYNKGVAFSLPLSGIFTIVVAILIIILLLIFTAKYLKKNTWKVHLIVGLIIGGAIGNVIDRIRIGEVIDFIKISIWPTFNIADSAIVIGSLLLVLFYDKLRIKETSTP